MKKHQSIPIFIPHFGCPNGCVFCNQRAISGHGTYDFASVRGEIERALTTLDSRIPAQIAFFGGSFTGIPREEMIKLLALAKEYVDAGLVSSLRLSTRPDYIDDAVLSILREYAVETIELGLQSISDEVLSASRRGHTREDIRRACHLVKQYGFSLVGQMMIGLPASSRETETETARAIVALGADAARIYPTVVFRHTALADMAERGEYSPLTQEEAIARSAAALSVFADAGVPVIRIGLQAGESLSREAEMMDSYHPAMGEMVKGRVLRDKLASALERESVKGKMVTAFVSPSMLSAAIGQHGENRAYLIERFGLIGLRLVPTEGYTPFAFSLKITDGKPSKE